MRSRHVESKRHAFEMRSCIVLAQATAWLDSSCERTRDLKGTLHSRTIDLQRSSSATWTEPTRRTPPSRAFRAGAENVGGGCSGVQLSRKTRARPGGLHGGNERHRQRKTSADSDPLSARTMVLAARARSTTPLRQQRAQPRSTHCGTRCARTVGGPRTPPRCAKRSCARASSLFS